MKKKADYLKILTSVIALMLLASVVFSLFSDAQGFVSLETTEAVDVSRGWKNVDTGEEETAGYVQVLPGGSLRLSRTLPDNLNDDNVLGYYDYGFRVMAFIDGESFYSVGGDSYNKFGTELSQAWRSIPLKAEYSGRLLTVIFENDTDATMRINLTKMQITYASSEVIRSISTSIACIIIIALCGLLCILLLVLCAVLHRTGFMEHYHRMMMLAMLSLVVGIWSWANSSLCQLLFANATFAYKLAYLTYPMVPMFIGMFYERVYSDNSRIFYVLNVTYRIALAIIYILYLTGLVPLSQSMFVAHVYLFTDLILGNVYAVREYLGSRNHVTHWAMVGQMTLLVISLLYIPQYYLYGTEHVFLYAGGASIAFIVCMTISQGIYSVEDMICKRRNTEVREQTRIDPATGGNSRLGLVYKLEEMDFKGIDAPWFLLMKLTNFAAVNELFNWTNGKIILSGIYSSNQAALADGDYQATVGQGEFAFILPAERDIDGLCRQLSEGMQQFMEKYWCNAFMLPRYAAVRIIPGDDLNKLMACAHLAYIGRNKGNIWESCVNYYDGDCADRIMKGQVLEDSVNRALLDNKMELLFTPVYDAAAGRICQAETELKWQPGAGGNLLESSTVSRTEKDALEIRANARHLELAKEALARYPGLGNIWLSMRVIQNCLMNKDFWADFRKITEHYGIDTGRLNFELPEGMDSIGLQELKGTVNDLHAMGAEVTAAGFDGSLGMLKIIEVIGADCVKLAPGLLEEARDNPDIYGSIASLTARLHKSGRTVSIGGVADREEASRLKNAGIDRMSGPGLAGQVSAEELIKMLEEEEDRTDE